MNVRRARILLVEDNPADADLLRLVLQKSDGEAELEVVDNGEEALARLKGLTSPCPESDPDLVLLDLNLPRVSGHEILAFAHQEPLLSRLPIVVLSSSDAPRDRALSVANGCADYLVKPGSLRGYREVVQRILALLGEARSRGAPQADSKAAPPDG